MLAFALARECAAPLNSLGYTKRLHVAHHLVCHGFHPAAAARWRRAHIDITLILVAARRFEPYVRRRRKSREVRALSGTYESMMRGIAAVKPGHTVGDIGAAIQVYAEAERCSVVRDFCGHGLGLVFHDRPNILHYGEPGEGPVLEPGMIFTVEPMINLGKPHVKMLSDGWTAVTRDRSLSAQFEHSVGVTETGCEVSPIRRAAGTSAPIMARDAPYSMIRKSRAPIWSREVVLKYTMSPVR